MDTNTSSITGELLSRMAKDDEKAFREVYALYWKKLYATAFKRLPDHDKVNDILQDIFLTLWARRHVLAIDNLEAYLMGAVRNQVLKKMEKEDLFTSLETLSAEQALYGSSADALVVREDLRKAYRSLVKTLTPAQQAIVTFRFEEDMSTEEIAQVMEISRKTVQNQLRTALIQMRSTLVTLMIAEWVFRKFF